MTSSDVSGPGVVVLGMHRSGTSVVTDLLHRAGLEAGKDPRLGQGGSANPRGFWEIQALTNLDEAVLRRLDGEWSAPPILAPGWEDDPRLHALRQRGARLFGRLLPQYPWVWKDPRLCLTLPFWRALGVHTSAAVVVIRNPLEVAMSLRTRDDLDIRLALALWERYTRSAVELSADLPTAMVSYDTVLSDPVSWIEGVRSWLHATGVPLRGELAASHIAAAIDASLRHSRQGHEELRSHADVSDEQTQLFEWLSIHQELGVPRAAEPLPPATPWMLDVIEERRVRRQGDRRRQARWDRRARRATIRSFVSAKDRLRACQPP